MKKLVVLISARASYSRIRSTLLNLQRRKRLEVQIVLSASASSSKYGNLGEVILNDGLEISWEIESQVDASLNSAMAKTVGLTIFGLADYLNNSKADAIMIIADRHETIAGSIAGSYLGLKTFHVQGGEITGNIDDKVRNANTHLSDYHFVANELAAERLQRFGISENRIFITGCPSLDVVKENKFAKSRIPELTGIGLASARVFEGNYLVVVQHAETTSALPPQVQIDSTIRAIDSIGVPALWIWPNSDHGGEAIIREIRKARENGRLKLVHFERSLKPELFLSILDGASCIVGNSSVALREGSLMGVPAVNIGGRQNNRLRGLNVVDVNYDPKDIHNAIANQINKKRYSPEFLYGSGESGMLIAELLEDLV
jgi:UDP-hydrolysing UDP-N-acetyl-D-glucosamine 2-epimerase